MHLHNSNKPVPWFSCGSSRSDNNRVGIELTTSVTPVGCSNRWATRTPTLTSENIFSNSFTRCRATIIYIIHAGVDTQSHSIFHIINTFVFSTNDLLQLTSTIPSMFYPCEAIKHLKNSISIVQFLRSGKSDLQRKRRMDF